MQKIIVIIIALMALLLFGLGLLAAFEVMDKKPEEIAEFNKSYWAYIINSVNGLLIINLTSLLGLQLFKKEKINLRQWVAFVYLLTLLVIFIIWANHDFDQGESMPVVIVEISKSFFALLLAALGMILKENTR